MELFYGVLLMLGAILLSNILNRFLPSFSVPVIQIILGIILSVFPSVYHFTLDPELFLILFLAPLLFHDGMHADKKSLWALKKPVIMLGLGLVFFTLAAALAPTDAVAVSSLGKRIKVPDYIRNMLEGETLINDASGIVSFQFAVAAMVTGSFSLFHAGLEFVYVAMGGVLKERSLLTENSFFIQRNTDTRYKALRVVSPYNENDSEEAIEMTDLVAIGFQIERDCIQLMFEQGRISRDTVKRLRNNIALMELQLKSEEF